MSDASDDIDRGVKKAKEGIKKGAEQAKKAADALDETIEDIDVEDEALKGIKEIEGLLATLSQTVKKKREEWEKSGVENTVKKDAEKAKDTVKETTVEVMDEVEKTARQIKKMLED